MCPRRTWIFRRRLRHASRISDNRSSTRRAPTAGPGPAYILPQPSAGNFPVPGALLHSASGSLSMAKTKTVVTVISKISDRPVNRDAALVVIHGLDLGRKYDLMREQTVVGRSSKADIQVDQEAISRNHARFSITGARVSLKDLGSTNGTYVNDEMISTDMQLRNGDLVKIGRTIFKFIAGGNIESAYHDESNLLTPV